MQRFSIRGGQGVQTDKAVACESGFHACEYPLDCFNYYSPAQSVFHEVEQSGDISKNGSDTKVASTKIKIGAEIGIPGIVKAAIEYTKSHTKPERGADEDYGASSATGDCGASSATGYCGASSATGYKGTAEAKHPNAVAVAWGYHGKARGVKGSHLVLADWTGDEDNYWTPEKWTLNGSKMVQVDGEKVKEMVWYTMVNGEVVEVEEV